MFGYSTAINRFNPFGGITKDRFLRSTFGVKYLDTFYALAGMSNSLGVSGTKFGVLDYAFLLLPHFLSMAAKILFFGSIGIMMAEKVPLPVKIIFGVLGLIPGIVLGVAVGIVGAVLEWVKRSIAGAITFALAIPVLWPLAIGTKIHRNSEQKEAITYLDAMQMGVDQAGGLFASRLNRSLLSNQRSHFTSDDFAGSQLPNYTSSFASTTAPTSTVNGSLGSRIEQITNKVCRDLGVNLDPQELAEILQPVKQALVGINYNSMNASDRAQFEQSLEYQLRATLQKTGVTTNKW